MHKFLFTNFQWVLMSQTRNQESEMGNIDYEKDMKLLLEISLVWYNIFTIQGKKNECCHSQGTYEDPLQLGKRQKDKKDPFTSGGKTEKSLVLGSYTSSIMHGQRRLVGYSLWGCKQLDMTESLGMRAQYLGNWRETLLQTRLTKYSSQRMVAT